MMKKRKLVAMLIVFVMFVSNFLMPLSNISIAAQSNVRVAISADSDSMLSLSQDGKTLTYTCQDETTFDFKLMNGEEEVALEKVTDEVDGRFYDNYVVTGIESNENLYIMTSPALQLDKVELKYNGESAGVFDGKTLNFPSIDDNTNNYEFRIESVHQDNPGEDPGDNPGQQNNDENTVFHVDFGEASWVIEGETVTATVEGKTINNGEVEITRAEEITLTGYNPETMEPVIQASDGFSTRLMVNGENKTSFMQIECDTIPDHLPFTFFMRGRTAPEEQQPSQPQGNTNTTVTISSNQDHEKSYIDGRISINGYAVEIPEVNPVPQSSSVDVNYLYDEATANGKVTIHFGSLFVSKYVGTITVNGTEYSVSDYINYADRTDWLNHYSHQEVGFDIEVNKADNYNIVMDLEETPGKDQFIGNFLWTTAESESNSDLFIGHTKLEVIKVVYEFDGQEITVEAKDIKDDPHIEYDPYREYKSLVVPEGAMCTMKITPEYGYQVTSFGVNGNAIVTGENVSEFTFPIHKGNFHLGAEVTKVDDKVDTKSSKVEAGSIKIANDEIDSGSVVLSVNDVELDKDKVSEFENAAGDYAISNYLDIDLDKVVFKGTPEDVWSESLHNLKNDATVSLELKEDIKGQNIIIVHNINDGDEYEVIEIESYDPDTNSVTFKTKSFSNYAIALKEKANAAPTEEPKEDNKETEKEKYTINEGDYTVVFSDDAGHEFKLQIADVLKMTDKDIKALGISKEEFNQAVKTIKENVKKYGKVLAIYNITVEDGNYEHNGEVTFKIKMTDEMKKFNSFKLVNIDEDNFSAKDVVETKVEGDYIVGNLYHLSVYALTAENVKVDNNTSNNPKTGDNIIMLVTIFGLASLGLVSSIKVNKGKKSRKH